MMISRQNRRLGDYVAGTLVVRDSKTAEIKPDWSADPAAVISSPAAEVQELSEQDLVVIETYLHRRFDLDPMVRMNTAIRVSQLVQSKTGLRRAADQSDDDFLESIARQMREQARFRAREASPPPTQPARLDTSAGWIRVDRCLKGTAPPGVLWDEAWIVKARV